MFDSNPFPGMNPWLERHWEAVHHGIIIYSRDQISDMLPSDLFAEVEETVYIVDTEWADARFRPDFSILERHESVRAYQQAPSSSMAVAEPIRIRLATETITHIHIAIRSVATDEPLITAIEVISPTNKTDRRAREQYKRKRESYYQAGANLVEIDLLREGQPLVDVPLEELDASLLTPYMACVREIPTEAFDSVEAQYYPLELRQRLPRINIPLRPTDPPVVFDMQLPVNLAYERGRYGMRIDYDDPPVPPLNSEDAAWARQLIAEAAKPA